MKEAHPKQALELSGGGSLNHLGGYERTKESTIGAVKNLVQGAGRLLFVSGKRWKGATQIAQGAFDAADVIPSAILDTARPLTSPTSQRGSSPYNYNISRAAGSFTNAESPRDYLGASLDAVHAIGFRAGSDIARALGGAGEKQLAA